MFLDPYDKYELFDDDHRPPVFNIEDPQQPPIPHPSLDVHLPVEFDSSYVFE